ncbi:MAG: CDP-alcohol phosphatidyltransferase family protein [Methyloceanibacter sp.]|uniref:CDP-alcohol phosphatidyltransferase family protein n=1 Tax=Methyloceanibacter sp. TaxID=1965321 RepID=UPI001D89E095|nr:CDP-alcohol phosphatidyltransferase family protein [Methyloceanibacter sp.]MCB1442737.1 CDP-alcohol phosphatidyltransferase family protein [Methyloceanibacter sp.]MCC0057669.1 CDP-alcohol phosphatidyltransferase family protein [Hyphomicrobiaceae bacterium]
MNIPNTLTFARIVSVPLLIWLIIDQDFFAAFVVFMLAGISDAADGYLAKRYGWRTELGAYLDPIADKALLVSIYVALGAAGHLPVWLVIAVVSRDVLIVGAVVLAWMMSRPVKVKPLVVSKVNTFAQISLAGLALAKLGLGLGLDGVVNVLIWVTGSLTILSAVAYFWGWLRHMMSYEPAPPEPQPRRRSRAERASRSEVQTP